MIWIRSALFNVALYGMLSIALVICWPLLLFGRQPTRWLFAALGRNTMFLCRVLLGITYEVKGRENIPKAQALYACKHQSVWDAAALLAELPTHSSILKQELIQIPLYGTYLKISGMIGVDRKQGTKALPMMVNKVKEIYAQGGEIFMFPEGTRTSPGEVAEYKRGIALLYEKLNVPVVPMALNSGVFWPRRRFRKTPGHVVLQFLKPIPAGLPRKEFMHLLSQAIETSSMDLYHHTQPKN